MFFKSRAKKAALGQTADMQTACQLRDGTCLVSVSGRVTTDSSPLLRSLLLEYVSLAECQNLTVDFAEVVYVDTSGLAVLVEALKAALLKKKTFHLSGLPERTRSLLERTGVLHLFNEVRDVPQ
ncbi:MAG TPA: STAS domain-containing protein [Bryobacteraceae bacterium]|nr:STAS domain-containing protein [Bryobacteraceae bacterium]